jgi:hypothetical protein
MGHKRNSAKAVRRQLEAHVRVHLSALCSGAPLPGRTSVRSSGAIPDLRAARSSVGTAASTRAVPWEPAELASRGLANGWQFVVQPNGLRLSCGPPAPQEERWLPLGIPPGAAPAGRQLQAHVRQPH